MTRVIVAPDSFQESLASLEVADAIARGVRRVLPTGHYGIAVTVEDS
jgi:glycerate kinase